MKELDAVVIGPKDPKVTIIWLHGLGASGDDFVPALPMLNLPKGPVKFILPHAPVMPVTLNQGMMMPAWFDLGSLDFDKHDDEKGIYEASQSVIGLIEQEIEAGIPAQKIILVGFSQGGALALYTALTFDKTLGGCAALSSYLPKVSELKEKGTFSRHDLPIFWGHGEHDDIVPFSLGRQAYESLNAHGWPIEFHAYPMAHEVSLPELGTLGRWIMQRTDL